MARLDLETRQVHETLGPTTTPTATTCNDNHFTMTVHLPAFHFALRPCLIALRSRLMSLCMRNPQQAEVQARLKQTGTIAIPGALMPTLRVSLLSASTDSRAAL